MPVRRRRPSSQAPSPYNIPNQHRRNENYFGGPRISSRGYRRQQRQRHSSWTIQEDTVKHFIPTSISEYGCRSLNNNGGSCMSLCGVLDVDSDENSPGYQLEGKGQKVKPHGGAAESNGVASNRSRCYSMPVDVPMRKNTGKVKKNKKSRSSGGYFFDKYMKRFRTKRSPSLGSDGLKSPDEKYGLKVNDIEMKEVSDSPMKNFRSNRQDMVVTESGIASKALEYHQLDDKYQYNEADDDAVFADDAMDDLYPMRFGTSTKWSAYRLNPTVPAIKTENSDRPSQLMSASYSGNNITVHVTATPLSPPPPCSVFPPLFWGDAAHGPRDSYMLTSPVPSLSTHYESNCCYSDSNSVTLKAMETLYLCNFRVSVDGEWLCLKELEQGCDVSKALMAYNVPDDTPLKDMNGEMTPSPLSSTTNSSSIEQLRIERKNLLGMAKLSIKGLIESSLSAGHTLDSDHAPLQQFFVIMEAVLRHGLKSPKHIFSGNKQFWGPLEAIEKIASGAAEITNSVRDLPGIKTHAGRARAWLRLALMQKRLADYFRMLVEHRDFMKEFYESESLVMSEEGIVLSGHLVGLNCIDANLCMKGDDLDNQNAAIDYSLYMRDGNRISVSSESELMNESQEEIKSEHGSENSEEQIQKLANQKNYLEERNRYLETTLAELQKRAGHTSTSNQLLEAELEATKISLVALREDRERLLGEKENMTVTHQKILHDRQVDLDMERDTLVQSKAGLEEMLSQVKKHLKHETQMRMDVEREVELQISLKQELEVAMKLLEKDIYDKQDSLVILREQLDNVKAINIEIYKKLQDKTDCVESKSKTITDLEEETKRLNTEVGKLKEKIVEADRQLDVTLERADRFSQNLDDSEQRRNALETNLQIEREWRKALELQVEKSGSQITQLQTELSMLQLLRQELIQVKNERDELRGTCDEQESTINDLAEHLGKSKENFQNLKDVHKSFAEKTWEKDKEVKLCAQCEKPFSLARRKHHCRNCGQIYCNTCSDNTMPLASSAKPVRVCDSCHTVLLQRYTAATP